MSHPVVEFSCDACAPAVGGVATALAISPSSGAAAGHPIHIGAFVVPAYGTGVMLGPTLLDSASDRLGG